MVIIRQLYDKIVDHLSQKEITLLIGPRQVGKTTIMSWMRDEMESQHIPTLFLNLDFESDATYFESQEKLLSVIQLRFGNEYGVVFIDEIQRKTNAGIFLKGIYDKEPGVKFVVSGSGSLELKEKITESLAGRKRVFEISPVSYREFVNYETNNSYADRLLEFLMTEKTQAQQLLVKYILYGGYPAVITSKDENSKRQKLLEILNSYLARDVQQILSIHQVSAYNRLISIMAQQAAMPVKYSSLSQYVNISANTVKEYLWYMQHTYILRESKPYYTNALKEIVKEPTMYFVDMGLLNLLRNNLFQDENTPAYGLVFQNFVFNELHTLFSDDFVHLKYWRTKDKAEVDIIIDYPGFAIPVEVKYKDYQRPSISRSLRSFIQKYQPPIAFIIAKTGEHEVIIEKTRIVILPFTQLYNIKQELNEQRTNRN